MADPRTLDWKRLDAAARRALVLRLGPREAAALARGMPRQPPPLDVLGAITARPDCTLGTALTVFVRGDPERFEQLEPGDFTLGDRRLFQFLLRLHDTINAGVYRFDPCDLPEDPGGLDRLVAPRRDRSPGRPIWGLEATIVRPVLELAAGPLRRAAGRYPPGPGDEAEMPRHRGRLRAVLGRLARRRV